MIGALLDRLERPFTFVVGKGGVGKTTTASGIALALADDGADVRLLSTDPAHSLADLFGLPADAGPFTGPSPCTPRLVLEETDATAYARGRLDALEPALRQIIEGGTYLDDQDAAALLEGSLPGLDEIGAALRLEELARQPGRVVVDTAPTGHTLRMLEAPAVVDGWLRVFRAMATKADTVASALLHQSVRMTGERVLDDLARAADAFTATARDADFVLVTGPGAVVRAETERLRAALEARGFHVAATVAARRPGARADLLLPLRPGLRGCDALRAWIAERPSRGTAAGGPGPETKRAAPAPAGPEVEVEVEVEAGGAAEPAFLSADLVVFAGKGGVGKTTSAAAAAVLLSGRGPVLLAGADPAGSLRDVLPDPPADVEVRELDADAELDRFRDLYRDEVERAFQAVGLDRAARLDREVVESLWGLAPPGIDELVAVARLTELEEGSRTVLDTAPTGHFLRLLAMPDLAGDWVRRIMRILLKYRALGGLDAPAEPLLRFARRLRALQERLSDPSRTAIVIVTLDEPIVRAETRRLLDRLRDRGIEPAAVLVNRAGPGSPDDDLAAGFPGTPVFLAPERTEPVGADALRSLARGWRPAP